MAIVTCRAVPGIMPRKETHHADWRAALGLLHQHLPRGANNLIDLTTGVSHGGFETLTGARQSAREKGLSAWDIFHGNVRVEYHDPR